MINWGRFIGNPDRKEVASMWTLHWALFRLKGVPADCYGTWGLYSSSVLTEENGVDGNVYTRGQNGTDRKIKDPIRRQWSDPFYQRWDSARWFERGSRGSERERCSGCRSLSFPDFTSIPHMEPLWLPPFSLCPLLSVLSDSELEAVLSFLSSWRVTSVHLWDEKMTISLPVFHLTRFFLFFFSGERLEGGRKLLHAGWKGAWRRSPARFVGGGRGSGCETGWGRNPRSLEMAGNDPRKTSAILVSSCPVGKCFP